MPSLIESATTLAQQIRDETEDKANTRQRAHDALAAIISSTFSSGQVYNTVAALKASAVLADGAFYYVKGYAADMDGGEGVFFYNASSTTTANDGSILAVSAGGRAFRVSMDGVATPQQFGAPAECTAHHGLETLPPPLECASKPSLQQSPPDN